MTPTTDGPTGDSNHSDDSETIDASPPLEPLTLRDGLTPVIDTLDALQAYARAIEQGSGPVALDAERASGYRYSMRAYLIQVRRTGAGTALIDPIAVPDQTPLNDAIGEAEWILHAATQDLPCLEEVGLRPHSLFDTEVAGRILGRERVSLAALVASELGFELEKGHGATDWSKRPLSTGQLTYAALDVEVLVELRNALHAELITGIDGISPPRSSNTFAAFSPKTRDLNRGVASRACTSCDRLDSGRWLAVCGRSETPSRSARTPHPGDSSRIQRSWQPFSPTRPTRPGC